MSLRGIAATAAIEDVYFTDCHAMAVHLKDGYDEVPIRIRTYNEETHRFESIERTITKDHLLPYPIWEKLHKTDDEYEYDPEKDADELPEWICEDVDLPKKHKPDDYDAKHVWVFDLRHFFGHEDTDRELLSVDVHDKRIENPPLR